MSNMAEDQKSKTQTPTTSVPSSPAVDTSAKQASPLGGKAFTPTVPAKTQGMWFKKLSNKIGAAGYKLFFSLQTLGGIGLAVSGMVEGNHGRMSTGLLNTSRNFLGVAFEKRLGPLKKIDPEIGRAGLMTAALGSNIPQFASAITLAGVTSAEIIAASCVVSAYTILSVPGWTKSATYTKNKIKDIMSNKKDFVGKEVKTESAVQQTITIKKPIKTDPSLSSKFARAARSTLHVGTTYVAPTLLFARASAQLADGIIRKDIAAIAAGTAFVAAPLTLLFANKYHRQKMAELGSAQKQKLLENGSQKNSMVKSRFHDTMMEYRKVENEKGQKDGIHRPTRGPSGSSHTRR